MRSFTDIKGPLSLALDAVVQPGPAESSGERFRQLTETPLDIPHAYRPAGPMSIGGEPRYVRLRPIARKVQQFNCEPTDYIRRASQAFQDLADKGVTLPEHTNYACSTPDKKQPYCLTDAQYIYELHNLQDLTRKELPHYAKAITLAYNALIAHLKHTTDVEVPLLSDLSPQQFAVHPDKPDQIYCLDLDPWTEPRDVHNIAACTDNTVNEWERFLTSQTV